MGGGGEKREERVSRWVSGWVERRGWVGGWVGGWFTSLRSRLGLRAGVRERPRSLIPSVGTPTDSRWVVISSIVRPRRGMIAL